MTYRPDIDGLRAIAVTLVILFHAKTGLFLGGYVGVDVFFAISGFLITSIIYKKMMQGDFSFRDFYKRRALRLLPASMFMTLVTVLFFAYIYPPDLFEVLTESALASLLFSSNIYFWQTSSYFSPSLELQPLLHTWSLSVEEQFYFFFPISLLILIKFGLKPLYTILLMFLACLISLTLAVIYAPNSLSFVGFYVLPTRFYEMGLGALLAIFVVHHPHAFSRLRFLRETGLVMVTISAFFYDRHLAFPSYYALLPVIGTLLMLADTKKSGPVYHILCIKPVVFIGLLSYSLYLWHWPIWVAMEWLLNDLVGWQLGAYFVITFIAAYLSYRLVERPLRNPTFYKTNLRKLVWPSLGLGLAASISLFMVYSNKPILPISPGALASYQNALEKEPYRDLCTDTKRLRGQFTICHLKEGTKPNYTILLWGDSHASAFMSAFVEFSDEYSVYAINTSGCPSLINTKRRGSKDCHLHNEFVQQHLLSGDRLYDLVVNVSAWDNYIQFNLLETDLTQTKQMQIALQETIEFYSNNGINYAFIPQIPKHEPHIPIAFFKQEIGIEQTSGSIPSKSYEEKLSRFNEFIYPSKNVVSLADVFCNKTCVGTIEDVILYQDQHHLSVAGGKLVAPRLQQQISAFIESRKSVALFSTIAQHDTSKYD